MDSTSDDFYLCIKESYYIREQKKLLIITLLVMILYLYIF